MRAIRVTRGASPAPSPPRTPGDPWAAELSPQSHLPEGPKGEGAGVPWSTTVLVALAGPSADEGRAAVGRGAS
jgi:hypothetical protein